MADKQLEIHKRFRGFLPVVIDVETGGFDASKHALLELGAFSTKMNNHGILEIDEKYHYHIKPYEGLKLDPAALEFNKINVDHPFRLAISEKEALKDFFAGIKKECEQKKCQRAVLVGHNSWFDISFLNAAILRNKFSKTPFHRFTNFDTATLSGLVYGQTVLSKALHIAKIDYDTKQAHSAVYDARCTAELFCKIVNKWHALGGWPLEASGQP